MLTNKAIKRTAIGLFAVCSICLVAAIVFLSGTRANRGDANAAAASERAGTAGPGTTPPLMQSAFGVELLKYDEIVPGVEYACGELASPPLVYHVVRADLRRKNLRLGVSALVLSTSEHKQRITEMVEDATTDREEPVAAINGDYHSFGVQGPWGIHLQNGNLIYSPSRKSALLIDVNGTPSICIPTCNIAVQFGSDQEWFEVLDMNRPANVREFQGFHFFGATKEFTRAYALNGGVIIDAGPPSVVGLVTGTITRVASKGEVMILPDKGLVLTYDGASNDLPGRAFKMGTQVRIKTSVSPAAIEAIGGGPGIVKGGQVWLRPDEETFGKAFARYLRGMHPRTATGLSKDRNTIIFLVAVGRKETSKGLTANDLARLMIELGAWDAMMFDGGGSSVMYTRKHMLVNKPKGRNLRNALMILAKKQGGT